MKNRKRVVVAFLLVAVLCLGIGYAALTDTLTISGTVSVGGDNSNNAPAAQEWDEDIYFVDISSIDYSKTHATDADKNASATIDTSDKDNITVSVPVKNLFVKGDYITFTTKIQNDNADYAANVSVDSISIADNDSHDFFNVELLNVSGTSLSSLSVPAEGKSDAITVKISLKKTPAEDISNVNFVITLTATTSTT